ncbi:bifunctional diguanylate cyclase/phosphodiesterase [Acidiferrobacter sp.]|uniref:putative bifunctional diguanylate cyclase/phosphodiesterase n=1 Tax=Acidiferrobacter sp. TaxID=1872107 RepID=UPI0026145AB9|nr:diguanylate cyclase [Acidiferrobacter sp.]
MGLRRRGWTINIVAALLIVGAGLVTGLVVFTVMRTNTDVVLRRDLVSGLALRAQWVARDIRDAQQKVRMVATRPFLADQLAAGLRARHAALPAVDRGLRAFLAMRLSALALYMNNGTPYARAGHFMAHPVVEMPLRGKLGMTLLWNARRGFVLRAALPIYRRRAIVGWVVGDAPLPTITRLLLGAKALRSAANIGLCGPAGTRMTCFPNTFDPTQAFSNVARGYEGRPLPMSYALAGRTGFIVTRNYLGHQVAAAYRPVDHIGLGMVLTMDTSALYAPVYREFAVVLPLIILVLAGALLVLRWQLAPLVTDLVTSERDARDAHARLKDSESHVQAVLSNVDEGIITISETGIIETFNPAAGRLFGYAPDEVIGRNVGMLMPEPHRSHHDDYLRHYRETGEARVIGAGRELMAMRRDGSEFPVDLRVSEFYLGDKRHFIGTLRDATRRKEAERHMEHIATHDALTDLPGRALILTRIGQLIRRAERSGQLFAVMFIDLDNFKEINDSLGHDGGDTILRFVARRLRETVRAEDTVGRLGGDEFVVLTAALVAPMDAALIAEKLLGTLSAPYLLAGHTVYTGASIGIALYPQDGRDADALLKHSDDAMYQAKRSGRGQYRCYDEAVNAASSDEVRLVSALHKALSADELALYYRPVRAADDHKVAAIETVLKWWHPEQGLLEADDFLAIAEEAGLAVPLAEWALRQAGRDIAGWRNTGLAVPPLFIRLGPLAFRDARLQDSFAALLTEFDLGLESVGVEIHEDDFMDDPEAALEALSGWHRRGMDVVLTDYGAGDSSLPYLKQMALRVVRLSDALTINNAADSESMADVATIIATLHALDIVVTASQVATYAQYDAMRHLGCDRFAGDLAGPLVRAGDFAVHLVPGTHARGRLSGHEPRRADPL